ncbi:hypothetical protein AX17_003037 [Amanita inopinata Kibby_2008]|nr:hypothetical protein AX17_003037 [Amanita inopinata Kibby_2008]
MSASSNLQIPSSDPSPGPSRHNYPSSTSTASARPVSVAVQPSPASAHHASSAAKRHQRASHTPVSSHHPHPHTDDQPAHFDVYAHPAAVAYAAAHPRRQIPKFGPYLLLQTLGEGEFGKVKLGLHTVWGEEVAVKLIRRGNVDTSVRMSKIEREIEVLRILKHPNIVRLYDVIETEKYIGIILEYASGGELFDHILAHRYLRERDATKLFSQLISGVWYIHQKKIVHRDLKLENLLLDRNRNVIITDFGFANRFEHRADDLMQTSCGSPCYAAPELVISEGLYVGSAVDIWSCGVILYAMLAGYLPFDDDPANPDGDNINLLYKYIVSTPLSFPDYISAEARDLLSIMLVPDPVRRASLEGVMKHPWLSAYAVPDVGPGMPGAFGKNMEDLEHAAMEQHQQKRLAYQRQMKSLAPQTATPDPRANRSLSYRPAEPAQTASVPSARSKSTQPAQSDYIYQSSTEVTSAVATPTHTADRTYGSPSAPIGVNDDDPFAGPASAKSAAVNSRSTKAPDAAGQMLTAQTPTGKSQHQKAATSPPDPSSFRHTIQVEYDAPSPSSKSGRKSEGKERKVARDGTGSQSQSQGPQQQVNGMPSPRVPPAQQTTRPSHTGSSTKPLPTPPSLTPSTAAAPSAFRSPPTSASNQANASSTKRGNVTSDLLTKIPIVNIASPPDTPAKVTPSGPEASEESVGQASISSKKGHRKGVASMDKIGFAKIFGGGSNGEALPSPQRPERVPSDSSNAASGRGPPSVASSVLLSPNGSEKEGKKSRRNTLTVMVEPLISRTIRGRSGKGRTAVTPVTADGASAASAISLASGDNTSLKHEKPQKPAKEEKPKSASVRVPQKAVMEGPESPFTAHTELGAGVERGASGLQASTNKARKVMQWFRTKSKGRDSVDPEMEDDKAQMPSNSLAMLSPIVTAAPPVKVYVTTPPSGIPRMPATPKTNPPAHPQRAASTATDTTMTTPSLVKRFRNSVTVGGHGGSGRPTIPLGTSANNKAAAMRVHHGAVDQTMVTTGPPPNVMKQIRQVLEGMGLEIQVETEYKFKCVRVKRKKGTIGGGMGVVAPGGVAGAGGAGSLAAVTMVGSAASNGVDKRGLPLPSQSTFSATGGMLRGLLMRRQSSQVSSVVTPTTTPTNPNQNLSFDDETSVVVSEPVSISEAAYGDPTEDAGDEVRFSVELTKIDRLNDMYSLDVRRLKGNLRSYRYLYDTIRQRANLQR